jgi:hypothetical protein
MLLVSVEDVTAVRCRNLWTPTRMGKHSVFSKIWSTSKPAIVATDCVDLKIGGVTIMHKTPRPVKLRLKTRRSPVAEIEKEICLQITDPK